MKKAVFFDIDGTLWNEFMEIAQSTIDAVCKLRENGHYAFLCSGRSRANIKSPKLLSIGFDGVIASCGAHIDFHKETEYEVLLTKKQIQHALRVLENHHIAPVLEGPEFIYVNENEYLDDLYVASLRKEMGQYVKNIPKDCSDIVINKMSCIVKTFEEERFRKEIGPEFDVIVHGGGVIEITPAGVTKATGIKRVCEMLHISMENTYAFGDSANDLEMLCAVSHGIAMGNGTEEVKKAAEYVTSSVDDDGILNGLLHYGLIGE